MDIFEKASRIGLIIESQRGNLTVTDLWHLPLSQLDIIARSVNRRIKDSQEESFISETKVDPVIQLTFDIVKHIIDVKLAENKASIAAKAKNAEILKLKELIANKANEELSKASLEDLQARLMNLMSEETPEN